MAGPVVRVKAKRRGRLDSFGLGTRSTPQLETGGGTLTLSVLADSEHPGATLRANALSRRLAILHGDGPGTTHLSPGTTLQATGFHSDLARISPSRRRSAAHAKRH